MNAKARLKLLEAEQYVEDAQSRSEMDVEYAPAVAIGHATDALILAVDALCHDRETEPPRRHDQGDAVFLHMIQRGLLPPEAASWRELLVVAAQQRASFQYHGRVASRSEARRFVRQVAAFVAFARSQIRL